MSPISGTGGTTNLPPAPPPPTDTLRAGETLADFAARHQVSEHAVRSANAGVLQGINNDRRHYDPGLSESQALAGVTLDVPAPSMSVGDEPIGSSFNPTYPTSNSEYTAAGQVGTTGGAITWNPGDGSIKLTGSSIITPPGQTSRSPAQFEARGDAALTGRVETVDGNTNVWAVTEVDSAYTAASRIETPRGPIQTEAGVGAGFAARYKVTLPGENQPASGALGVNPFDPTTIPIGGSVTMDARDYVDVSMAASFNYIGTQFGLRDATGASYSVNRVDANTITVTMGPYDAVEAFNGVGVRSDVATAMLGRQDNLSDSRVGTATFDLSNPDAQAAYAHFVATGEVAHETAGVSDVATIERVDYSSQTRLQLGIGPDAFNLQADLAGAQNTGSFVRSTYPDGSYSYVSSLQYSGNVPLQVTQRFDASGAEVTSERSYQITVNTDHDVSVNWFDRLLGADEQQQEASLEQSHAQLLNAAFTGDFGGSGPVVPGQSATITFSEAQMQSLMTQTRGAAEANTSGMDPLALLVGGENGQPVATSYEFAVSMARNLGGSDWGTAERLFNIAQGADGDVVNGFSRIDATVTSR